MNEHERSDAEREWIREVIAEAKAKIVKNRQHKHDPGPCPVCGGQKPSGE